MNSQLSRKTCVQLSLYLNDAYQIASANSVFGDSVWFVWFMKSVIEINNTRASIISTFFSWVKITDWQQLLMA